MPVSLDLEGHDPLEALKAVERLSPARQAALFARPTSYGGLFDTLTEVDMLAELAVPEEVAGCSRFSWLKTGEGQYLLNCGSGEQEKNRQARLCLDALGNATLTLSSDQRGTKEAIRGTTLREIFVLADARIRLEFEGAGMIASRDTRWRSQPPSDKQLKLLRKHGASATVVAGMTKGDASAWLDRHFEQKRAQGGVR